MAKYRINNFTKKQLLKYFTADAVTGKIYKKKTGRELGSLNSANGYYLIWVEKKLVKRSFLIWTLTNDNIVDSSLEIDHINSNKADDRIINLRLVSRSQNSLNINNKLHSNNISGVRGVHWEKFSEKWVAGIRVRGRDFIKRFKNLNDAITHRKYLEKIYGI